MEWVSFLLKSLCAWNRLIPYKKNGLSVHNIEKNGASPGFFPFFVCCFLEFSHDREFMWEAEIVNTFFFSWTLLFIYLSIYLGDDKKRKYQIGTYRNLQILSIGPMRLARLYLPHFSRVSWRRNILRNYIVDPTKVTALFLIKCRFDKSLFSRDVNSSTYLA